jgi:hypothetical protein
MNLIEKNPSEFLEFNHYLEKISDSVQRSDLRWYFDFKLYEFDSLSDSVKNIIARVYPNVDLERATTARITFAEMLERLNEKLSSSLRPRGEIVDRARPIVTEYSDLWWCLAEYVDFSRAQIYEYTTTNLLDGFGSGGILENFSFVIIDEQTRRILFFSGGDCD